MDWPTLLSLPLLAGAVIVVVAVMSKLLEQLFLAPPPELVTRARRARVQRRHMEPVGSWRIRIQVAEDRLRAAANAFILKAQQRGYALHTPYVGPTWALPTSDPLSIELVAARYPDGPSTEELFQIANGLVVDLGDDDIGPRAHYAIREKSERPVTEPTPGLLTVTDWSKN